MTRWKKIGARNAGLAGILLSATLSFHGCRGDRDVAALTAQHLHSHIVAFEVMLNDRIAHEKNMNEDRLELIREEEADILNHNLEQFRRHKAAELADAMSADPDREGRMGNVIHFLNDAVQAEYALYRRLQDKKASAAAELEAALAKLDQHRAKLAQIEEQCAALSTKSKLRNSNKILMASVDDLLDQFQNDQQQRAAARRKGRGPRLSKNRPQKPANGALTLTPQ
jgi:hypothetical protein